eukprot:superscaffoldBa00007142_g22260
MVLIHLRGGGSASFRHRRTICTADRRPPDHNNSCPVRLISHHAAQQHCTSLYSGTRCMFYNQASRKPLELEQLIGITFGVVIVVIILAIIICCFVNK